jgi:hypothetical protein
MSSTPTLNIPCRIGSRDIGLSHVKIKSFNYWLPYRFYGKIVKMKVGQNYKLLSNFRLTFFLTSCGTERKARKKLTQKQSKVLLSMKLYFFL